MNIAPPESRVPVITWTQLNQFGRLVHIGEGHVRFSRAAQWMRIQLREAAGQETPGRFALARNPSRQQVQDLIDLGYREGLWEAADWLRDRLLAVHDLPTAA